MSLQEFSPQRTRPSFAALTAKFSAARFIKDKPVQDALNMPLDSLPIIDMRTPFSEKSPRMYRIADRIDFYARLSAQAAPLLFESVEVSPIAPTPEYDDVLRTPDYTPKHRREPKHRMDN